MAIDPEAIQRFLEHPAPDLPRFKGEDPLELQRLIYNCTGAFFEPKTAPRPHQLEGVAAALYMRRALLFYWMRLGKTKIGLDWATHLRRANLWRGLGIVIAHAPIGVDVWQGQIEQHSDLRAAYMRTGQDPVEVMLDAIARELDLVVAPWSVLQSIFTEKRENRKGVPKLYPARDLLREAAESFSLAIIDEIHLCKNWMSLRFEIATLLLAQCRFRLGLTGTPFASDPMAIWPQAYLIDEGKTLARSFQFFEQAFGVKRPVYGAPAGTVEWKFDKTKLPLLQHKLSGVSLSYKLEEVREVNIQRSTIELTMQGDQKTAYREALSKVVQAAVEFAPSRNEMSVSGTKNRPAGAVRA